MAVGRRAGTGAWAARPAHRSGRPWVRAGLLAALLAAALPLVLARSATAAPGQPFTFLQSPFTQAVFGVSSGFLGGVAFAPDGDVWSNDCAFSGSPLHRFDRQGQYFTRGTTLHQRSTVSSNAGCGMTNHPDGRIYSNTSGGVSKLDAATGAPLGVAGPAGNALGIAVDPQDDTIVYVGANCRFTGTCSLFRHDPATGTTTTLAALPGATANFIDGISFDPTGQFLFLAVRSPAFRLVVLTRTGTVVQQVPMGAEPDGISFRATDPKFVVTNNLNGTMTRFDFPGNDFAQPPTLSTFASGGFRGDLSLVGPDGCIYLTQAGTHYLDGTTTGENSVVQVCPGFAPPPGVLDSWVMVALGDSYSSGEGAPPFEDGVNYAPAIEQENTLTFGAGHNDCHRSLTNYAKVAAPTLEPNRRIILVDRTCSGAEVHPDEAARKGPIAPTAATADRDDGQVDQALDRLARLHDGRDADDVRLVSLTMGGNDAGFGDIVAACLIPNMAQELFRAYPDTPGEIEWLVNRFGSCERIDDRLFHTGDRIEALGAIEREAQANLADRFALARILQLTYPGVVPDGDHFDGDSCGGLLRRDIEYVRGKVDDINDQIRAAIADTRADTTRYEAVDIQDRFGPNALCPADPDDALANGLNQEALRRTVEDLVAPGTESRALLDTLVSRYRSLRNCIARSGLSAFLFCRGHYDRVQEALEDLQGYFTPDRLSELVGGLAPGDTAEQRFDNSRNLFHPNAVGFGVMACNLEAVYHRSSQSACTPSFQGVLRYLFNNVELDRRTPTPLVPGAPVPFEFNGFDPGRPVGVRFFSDPVDLGSVVAGADGVITGQITIPAGATPGVHTVEFAGTNNGSPRAVRVLVELPGSPTAGETYGVYLCCLPADEEVAVDYLGFDWGTYWTDRDGGVYLEVPAPVTDGPVTITGTGVTTGQSVTHTFTPEIPDQLGLWARAGDAAAVVIDGDGLTADGGVHSDGGVVISADGVKIRGGLEYATTYEHTGHGGSVDPAAAQTAPGGLLTSVELDDWRPGGPVAAELGDRYQSIPPSACVGGVWRAVNGAITGEVVYVPCAVDVVQHGPLAATIVAEGTVRLIGNVHVTTAQPFSIISGDDVVFAGAARADAPLWGIGDLTVTGRGARLPCGAYAERIAIRAPGVVAAACPG